MYVNDAGYQLRQRTERLKDEVLLHMHEIQVPFYYETIRLLKEKDTVEVEFKLIYQNKTFWWKMTKDEYEKGMASVPHFRFHDKALSIMKTDIYVKYHLAAVC